jgi:hypothetical protein
MTGGIHFPITLRRNPGRIIISPCSREKSQPGKEVNLNFSKPVEEFDLFGLADL